MTGGHEHLEKAREDLGARLLLVADASGYVLDSSGIEGADHVPTLAALAVANMAAIEEIRSIAGIGGDLADRPMITLDGASGCVVVCAGNEGQVLVAVLGDTGTLGLSRLELRRLAGLTWSEAKPPSLAEVEPDFSQQLARLLCTDV